MESETNDNTKMQEFGKLIRDMSIDVLNTFPELQEELNEDLKVIYNGDISNNSKSVEVVYEYCKKVYPERFFDILYENADIFKSDSSVDVCFLPGVDFRALWGENISDKTRSTIWKYLQLILFSIISGISDTSSFGDTAKLFEAIGEEEFKTKLEETITQMEGMFNKTTSNDDSDDNASSTFNAEDLPNAQDIHEHVLGMMDGKLGTLAREIAEETARDMQVDLENITTANDVFKQLFKNPASLMKLVKTVGSKLDDRLQSGDIKESELLEEAQDMMKKMKNMPGMGNLQGLLGKMGMGGGGKMNTGAMQAQLSQRMRMAQTKERMRSRVQSRQEKDEMTTMSQEEFKNAEERAQQMARDLIAEEDGNTTHVFKSGDGAIRSTRADKPESKSSKNKKNKKKKKGKGRK